MGKHAPVVRNSSFLNSLFIVFAMLLFFVIVSTGALRLLVKEKAFSEQIRDRVVVQNQLEKTHKELLNDVAFIESERGQDEAIRRQFDVVREGELLVIIPDGYKKSKIPIADETNNTIQPTVWQKLMFWR